MISSNNVPARYLGHPFPMNKQAAVQVFDDKQVRTAWDTSHNAADRLELGLVATDYRVPVLSSEAAGCAQSCMQRWARLRTD